MGLIRTCARRRLSSAVTAAALYAASAVVVPLVHARTEVLRSASEVEAQHTDQCPRIHAEATCVVGSTFQFHSSLLRVWAAAEPRRVLRQVGARAAPIASRDAPRQHPVRAPPAL